VLDRSRPLTADDLEILAITPPAPRIVIANKSDLPAAWNRDHASDIDAVPVSAATGAGMDALRRAITAALAGREPARDTPAVTNIRHSNLLSRARDSLRRAAAAAAAGVPEELVAADLGEARGLLEEVTGARTPDDVLRAIFERFCIGK
jgi:tRNA modification GTPase